MFKYSGGEKRKKSHVAKIPRGSVAKAPAQEAKGTNWGQGRGQQHKDGKGSPMEDDAAEILPLPTLKGPRSWPSWPVS